MPDSTAPPTSAGVAAPQPPVTSTAPVAPPPVPPPVTTVATVTTTTTTPGEAAIQWYKTQRFIALVQSTVLWVMSWFIAALSSNDWAWRACAIGVATNIFIVLKDWWSPSVIAPFASLNKNNVDASK